MCNQQNVDFSKGSGASNRPSGSFEVPHDGMIQVRPSSLGPDRFQGLIKENHRNLDYWDSRKHGFAVKSITDLASVNVCI